MQGLRNSRKFTKGEFDHRVGNGARVAVVAILMIRATVGVPE